MPAADPDLLDRQAAVLYDTAAWQAMVGNWAAPTTSPAQIGSPLVDQVVPEPSGRGADLVAAVPGLLLTKTTAQLVADAGITTGPAPADRQLPGRIAALIPDSLHTWRRLYQPDLKPSVQLYYAGRVLLEWGWQNQPYRLRDIGGARCICGAILTAHRLGHGTATTAERSAGFVLSELRHQGWAGLIGEWNRAPGRTAHHATTLIAAAAHRAAQAGH